MQPCPVCGAMTVDANGYCTRCGTFRGQPAPPVSAAPYAPSSQPQGYQPYPPTSAAPYPFSGPPISGGGYSAPPAAPTRNRFIGPLIASVAVLVLLVGAIVVLAIVRSGKHDVATGPTGTPTGPASVAPSTAIDPCLVGTWQASSERQQQDFPSVGPITMIGKGQISHVHADGQVDDDYSQATPYTGSYNGHVISMVVTGTVHSTITTAGGTLSVHDPQANGSVVFKLDGSQLGSAVPLSIDTDPVQYTCLNNTATEHTSQYDVTLTKISPNP
jgi:hypothetical protein